MASEPLVVAEESQDATDEYLDNRRQREVAAESASFLNWLGAEPSAGRIPGAKALDPFPTDMPPPANQSTVGKVVRSVAEMPRQAVGGIDDAGRNAFKLMSSVVPQLDSLAEWLNDNVADLRYDPVSAPKTATGRVTRSTSEFLTGFIPALKGMKLLGTGAYVAPLAAGAIADFTVRDPHDKRLSDLWRNANLPENVLTDYLASNETDTATEGRFKNALEGVLVGATLDGVLRGAKALRAMHVASKEAAKQSAEASALAAMKEQYGELTAETSQQLMGDATVPLVETIGGKLEQGLKASTKVQPRDIAGAVAQTAATGAAEPKVFINFARISSPDDVKAVIDEMAQRFAPSIKEAQRGVISQGETIRMADELGMTASELIARRQGIPFNAETALAARRIWGASAENLLTLAKKAADPNAGAVDVFAFRKALATHHAIQAEVIGARTETARALASWRIPAGGGVEQAKALQEIVQASGGSQLGKDLASRMVILAEHGDKRALGEFVRKSWGATTFDAVREVWINGLLSSPATHVVNSSSNAIVAFQQMYERGTASLIGQVTGGTESVAPGEAMAMAHGVTASIKDAFRLAWKALKTGDTGESLGKIDLPMKHALSAETFRMSSETGLGRAVDVIGTTARVPGRLLGAEDEFFKVIGYRMELHAQVLRQATQEGLQGAELAKRMEELLLHPSENLRIAATDGALYSTFTQAPGAVGQAFMKMRERIPAITFVMPFVKTPVNIARYTFERTPFAPLVGQWRADILAGGARADIALARMATGTTIMLTALDYADSGRISGGGPKDAGEREAMTRQGWQPYSLKVGNRWYSYNRTDPLGSMLGFSADTAERIRGGEINQDDVDEWQEVVAMGITAVSKTAINKTYLRGIAEFVDVMQDPDRYSERYVTNMLASFVPFTALSGSVERAVDPTVRETNNPWDAINAKVAFLSDKLPPRRNLWGEEIKAESGLGRGYDFFSPVQSREIKPSPIDAEIMRLAPIGAADNVEGAAPQRIGKRTSFDGVTVNFKEWPKEYDAYVKMSGNDLKHPAFSKGAKDFLDDLVSGKNAMSAAYKIRSDPMKLGMIKNVISQYRALAQQEMMNDTKYANFSSYVRSLKEEKQRSRMPVLEGTQ